MKHKDDAARLLRFYRGEGVDDAGRTLDQILAWDDAMLEYMHDYIQWLFPLRVPSSFHPEAPVLTDEVVGAFHADPTLRSALMRSLNRMLAFYGLKRGDRGGAGVIEPSDTFPERRRVWLRPNNHNHLRLTRILTCLRELGLPAEADALRRCLKRIAAENPGTVTDQTLRYWASA